MARKKTITKDQILNAAYDVVATEGFSKLTARNIAAKMKCSTQPIYLEFENMDDLKEALFDKIHSYLSTEVFPEKHTGNTIIDLALNYIHFAKKESKLYRALYLEEYGGGQRMQEFSYNYFSSAVKKDPKYAELTDKQINSLHMGTWIVATGVASLMTSGIIHPTDEQIEELMKESVETTLERNVFIDIS
ncbi:TetR/AcrR family transcriptional regulator [Enterococcus sp. BWB1-3]|uniref:TetR/AcrR family transcriptional regulator n=1 Tax=unclassified Enterococcus TaxID=2608891 RepID=UPI00192304DE|nr:MULTISPECIES: TetR/AcrR family transcriptional regulator [unclassified Enterococcus]MBL1230772.1 TetR/AcrR family transcriptional regulator [Enterococcus sp. BWB1-3]MCB5956229.1 TetR/AcrR family transcriptional regulator [Enterococcus sp. CWB-B31]